MAVPIYHLVRQAPSLWATLSLLFAGRGPALVVPGPTLTDVLRPRAVGLVSAYTRFCGGSPWPGQLPPHLFPQWGWPLITRALRGSPYDLKRAVNAGCTWTLHRPLPLREPLRIAGSLAIVDDDGRRALLTIQLVTGTASAPDALESSITVYVPLANRSKDEARSKERALVPLDAAAIAERRLSAGAGRDFALLTGDPNPIHWLRPYARASGFSSCILHGFAQAAITAEALVTSRFSGDTTRLRGFQARFVRPLTLPARVRVYQRGPDLWLGTLPGAPAFLVGAWNG